MYQRWDSSTACCRREKVERGGRVPELLEMERSNLGLFYLQKFKCAFSSSGLVKGCVVLDYQVVQGLCSSHSFSQNCMAGRWESFPPGTMVTSNLCIKTPCVTSLFLRVLFSLGSALLCARQDFSVSLLSFFLGKLLAVLNADTSCVSVQQKAFYL